MDKEKILSVIKQILEQEELSVENRASLESLQREVDKSKTNGEIKNVIIDFCKFLFTNYDKFMDFFP